MLIETLNSLWTLDICVLASPTNIGHLPSGRITIHYGTRPLLIYRLGHSRNRIIPLNNTLILPRRCRLLARLRHHVTAKYVLSLLSLPYPVHLLRMIGYVDAYAPCVVLWYRLPECTNVARRRPETRRSSSHLYPRREQIRSLSTIFNFILIAVPTFILLATTTLLTALLNNNTDTYNSSITINNPNIFEATS